MRKCDCNLNNYPNISILSAGIQFNITPDMYLFTSASLQGCYLGIQPLSMSFIILGDVFLQHNTVIFDKQKNQMGFIDNYKKLYPLLPSENYIYIFDCLELGLILVGVGIFMLTPRKEVIQQRPTNYELFR